MSSKPLRDHRPPATPFHCALCQKSYARIHDFEAHENSYDHQHKKRFQEMKALQRPMFQSTKKADNEVRKVEVKEAGGGTIKKKAGFKSAFGGGGKVEVKKEEAQEDSRKAEKRDESPGVESSEDEAEGGLYDPERPTD